MLVGARQEAGPGTRAAAGSVECQRCGGRDTVPRSTPAPNPLTVVMWE